MALATFVLCHRSAEHVADLVRLTYRADDVFLLHADAKAPAELHATLAFLSARFPNVHVLPSVLCSWAGWSLVYATLRGIVAALSLPAAWDHFVLLSEQHIPLHTAGVTAAALTPGVSYLDASPVSAMSGAGRADVMHRFAVRHEELAGVGMFPVAARRADPGLAAVLQHGSQWMVLARAACERLAALPADGPLWAPFRTSLLADETALQTILCGTDIGRGLSIERRQLTYVAWPHLSGNNDMTFTEANFHDARASGHLFIRKRPPVLPASVAATLPAPRLWDALPSPSTPVADHAAIADFANVLHQALHAIHPDISVTMLLPHTPGESAACYVRCRIAALPPPLSVYVLSEDVQQFKALLVWDRMADGVFGMRTLGGLPAIVLKVRLPDIFERHEVLLPDVPDAGFVQRGQDTLLERLSGLIATLLATGARLADAVAPGG